MYGKLVIKCNIKVLTGMHIGGSSVFSAIGAVDSPVAQDLYTHQPIIPGSSLKGKLRTLLSRLLNNGDSCKITEDVDIIKRLFGSHEPDIIPARLQFADCFVTPESVQQFKNTGLTEIKWENTIDRITSVANPRQIERVVPGVCFECRIAYTINNESDMQEDLQQLAEAMKLLQMDYLGGHGTRGSGRISFEKIEVVDPENRLTDGMREELTAFFKDVESYDLLSV